MANKPKYHVTVIVDCAACDGTGIVFEWQTKPAVCVACNGTGVITSTAPLLEALEDLGILPRIERIERTAGRAAYYADAMANGGI